MNTFGERLRKLRTEKGLSAIEFAEKFKVHRGTVSNWETGKRTPDADTLSKLSTFFDVSIDYLLGETDSKEKTNIYCDIPSKLTDPQEAIKFLLSQPSFMKFGEYDISKLKDEDLLDFANEILNYLKYISQKYNR